MSQYVLITGANTAISEVFANRLAQQGYNLIIVANQKDQLESLAQSLTARYHIEVQSIPADLSLPGAAFIISEYIKKQQWHIEGLINNATLGNKSTIETNRTAATPKSRFDEQDNSYQLQMIQVNITTLVDLTHRLLDNLKRGVDPFVINVASMSDLPADPNQAIYYASKAFVLSFSQALHEELKSFNIRISALCPDQTHAEYTEHSKSTKPSIFKLGAITSEAIVDIALRNRHRAIIIPGLKNKLHLWLAKLSPRAKKIASEPTLRATKLTSQNEKSV